MIPPYRTPGHHRGINIEPFPAQPVQIKAVVCFNEAGLIYIYIYSYIDISIYVY